MKSNNESDEVFQTSVIFIVPNYIVNRNQNNKPHSRNQGDRTESRPPHERHGPLTTTRSSPRSEQLPHSGGTRGRGDRHSSSHSETSQNSHSHSSQGGSSSHQHHPHHHQHHQHQAPHHHHHHPGGASTPSPTATPTSSSSSSTPAASVKEGAHSSSTAAATTATVSSSSAGGPHALPASSSSTGSTAGSTTTAAADVSADTSVTAAPRPRTEQHVDPAAMRDKDGPRRMDRYRSRRRREDDVKGGPVSATHIKSSVKLFDLSLMEHYCIQYIDCQNS